MRKYKRRKREKYASKKSFMDMKGFLTLKTTNMKIFQPAVTIGGSSGSL